MFGSCAEHKISSQGHSTKVITPNNRSWEGKPKFLCEIFQPTKLDSNMGKSLIFSLYTRDSYNMLFFGASRN